MARTSCKHGNHDGMRYDAVAWVNKMNSVMLDAFAERLGVSERAAHRHAENNGLVVECNQAGWWLVRTRAESRRNPV